MARWLTDAKDEEREIRKCKEWSWAEVSMCTRQQNYMLRN